MMMGIIALASCSDDPVVQAPSAGFSFEVSDFDVTFTNASLDADSYSWDFGDNSGTSNELNPQYTYSGAGDYEVSLTVANAGGLDTHVETVTIESAIDYNALLAGRWVVSPEASAVGVGEGKGNIGWWSNSADDVTTRACFFDDVYVFNADGSYSMELGDGTWLEQWQGVDPPACGAGIAPHDGSSTEYTFSAGESTFQLFGQGAYVGIAKAYNMAELGLGDVAPESITYDYELSADGNTMTVSIQVSDVGYWQYKMEKAEQ